MQPHRGSSVFRALAVLFVAILAAPSGATAGGERFDLTGDWTITSVLPLLDGTVHIVQDGQQLVYDGYETTIDLSSGEWTVIFDRSLCPAGGLFELTAMEVDDDHFDGVYVIDRLVIPFGDPCRRDTFAVTGARIRSPMATATATSTPLHPTMTPGARCVGDCNENGRATVDEIVALVRCAIGLRPTSIGTCDVACADASGNGSLEVNELVIAVNNVLHGCPS